MTHKVNFDGNLIRLILRMAAAAVLEHQSEPADISDDGLYEFVLNSDGSTTKITHKNSKGRRCKKCGCRCPCSCEDCKPFCCTR
ncbi:MAG: hypothetical protein ACJ719_01845 [Nitrososphaeraceae archaeon]